MATWWRKIAQEEGVPPADIAETADLLQDTLSQRSGSFECSGTECLACEPSLRRLLKCDRFNCKSDRSSACATDYFVAFCICQSLSGQGDAVSARPATLHYYRELSKLVMTHFDDGFRLKLSAATYARWQQPIRQLLDQMTQEIDRRVEELSRDALYPGFKKPLSRELEDRFLRRIEENLNIPVYGRPTTMMVTDDEDFAEKLVAFASDCVRRYFFYATDEDVRLRVLENTYWGRCDYFIAARDGFWPVDIRITPISTINARQAAGSAQRSSGVTR